MFHNKLTTACEELLKDGVYNMNMPMGIVSHIYSGIYRIVAINHPMGVFIAGAVFSLNETYCRDVVVTQKTIAINEINGGKGLRLHPLYISLPLEAYIGTPIISENQVWGTINFTSTHVRKPFTATDITRIESYAKRISGWLTEINTRSQKSSYRTRVMN
jgi:hypothetical protein